MPTGTGKARGRRGGAAACAIVCLGALAAGVTGAATAAPSPGKNQPHQTPLIPALTISAASVTTGNGKLKGSATVHNGGEPTGRRV